MIELLCLVMGLQWLSEVVVDYFALPIPPCVLGLLVLLILIRLKPAIEPKLAPHSASLLSHFSLFFIPTGTGIVLYFELIQKYWTVFTLVVSLSTVLTLSLTALFLVLNKKFEVSDV